MEPNKLVATLKRPAHHLNLNDFNIEASKKRKIDNNPIFKLAEILVLDQPSDTDKNIVWMDLGDINELFGSNESPNFVQIADRVYKVALRNIPKGSICINSFIVEDIKDSINERKGIETVLISPYHSTQNFDIKFILLQIDLCQLFKKQVTCDINELQTLCRKKIVGTLINHNQDFILDTQNGTILTHVKALSFSKQKIEKFNFGVINKDTKIYFETVNFKRIALIQHIKNDKLIDCSISVRLKYNVHDDIYNDLNDFFLMDDETILIQQDSFIDEIYKHLEGKPLFKDFVTDIEFENKTFEISLKWLKGSKIEQIEYNCRKSLFLNKDTKFNLISNKDELIFIKGDTQPIKECSFEVIDILETAINRSSLQSLKPWINVAELQNQLLIKKEFAIGQYFNISTSTGLYVIKLISAEKYPDDEMEVQTKDLRVKHKWSLNEKSTLNFTSDPILNLKFIKDETAFNLSSLSFEVQSSNYLTTSTNARAKDITVLEIDLEEAIQKEINYPIVEGQVIEVKILNESFLLTAKNMIFSWASPDQKFQNLAVITKETVFNFIKKPEQAISIIAKKGNLHAEKLIDALKEIGLGGIKDQLEQLIRRVVIFHDSGLKADLDGYGLKPVKGMIFYGPPGTGKTTLARNFSKYLGCPPERIKLVSGPEIFNKFVGESEKNIRNLFEDAKVAQAKYGDKSPLHVIVFDEFDAIAAKRESGNGKWVNSVVDQLLAVMDGLTELKNILVIGITNRIDSLDPAIKRPGRFEFHLEIGLPDEVGRQEIFEIYTRDLVKSNRLAQDVDLKEWAKKTEGFSGADIEGLVRTAISYPLDRLYKNRDLEKEAKNKLMQVSKKDFSNALIEVKKNRGKEDSKVPFGMYS